jgi:hypothetical protein
MKPLIISLLLLTLLYLSLSLTQTNFSGYFLFKPQAAPQITYVWNTKTLDNTTSLNARVNDLIIFEVHADQSMDEWHWFLNGKEMDKYHGVMTGCDEITGKGKTCPHILHRGRHYATKTFTFTGNTSDGEQINITNWDGTTECYEFDSNNNVTPNCHRIGIPSGNQPSDLATALSGSLSYWSDIVRGESSGANITVIAEEHGCIGSNITINDSCANLQTNTNLENGCDLNDESDFRT